MGSWEHSSTLQKIVLCHDIGTYLTRPCPCLQNKQTDAKMYSHTNCFSAYMIMVCEPLRLFSTEWKMTMIMNVDFRTLKTLREITEYQRTFDITGDLRVEFQSRNVNSYPHDIQSYICLICSNCLRELTVHSFWKAVASLMSVSTLATVSPTSVISHTVLKWLSKLLWNKWVVKLVRLSEHTTNIW